MCPSALIKIHGLANSLTNESEEVKKGSLCFKGDRPKITLGTPLLRECFLEGRGVNLDKELALVHFQAAADRGYGRPYSSCRLLCLWRSQ